MQWCKSARCVPLFCGCQTAKIQFDSVLINYQHSDPIKRLVVLSATVTCFTLCSMKRWCAAAVESVHSVSAGPVVLTGITCTVIDICFKRLIRLTGKKNQKTKTRNKSSNNNFAHCERILSLQLGVFT